MIEFIFKVLITILMFIFLAALAMVILPFLLLMVIIGGLAGLATGVSSVPKVR